MILHIIYFMFCDFKNYKITDCSDELCELLLNCCKINEENMSFLLNKGCINNIVEKIVQDIASSHLKEMNIKNDENIFIEFWFKSNENPSKLLHLDCDEYDRQINNSSDYGTPLLSCITYLNDNKNIPTIITNIDKEKFKYKEIIEQELELCLSFPKKLKHITFNGGKYYHGALPIENKAVQPRNLFLINIWKKKPLNIPIFDPVYFFYKYALLYKKEIPNILYKTELDIILEESIKNILHIEENEQTGVLLNKDLYEKMLYNDENEGDIYLLKKLKEILKTKEDNDNIIIKNKKYTNSKTAKKMGFEKIEKIDVNENKFAQRFIIKNHFTNDICKWIINECEEYALLNGGWCKNRHKNYPTTDLKAESVSNVFRFILTSFITTINTKIIDSYNLSDENSELEFDFSDIFIVKYEKGQQEHLEMHTDESTITVNILLSDPKTDFAGGGTYFEDELVVNLEKGDMLLHCGKTKHSGLSITEGKRYLLVYFVIIKKKEKTIIF